MDRTSLRNVIRRKIYDGALPTDPPSTRSTRATGAARRATPVVTRSSLPRSSTS
jgi:hypothetical protein